MDLANRVRPGIMNIAPYEPGLTDDELKHRFGLERVVKLNANENALGPSPLALEAIRQELQSLHHYPEGSSELLRRELALFHGVSEASILVGNGSDDIIKLLSETFLEPGDEVVVPKPSFSQYGFGAAIMRATTRSVPLGQNFEYDMDALAAGVNENTKFLYLCSPNNPTGTTLTAGQLTWLLQRVPENVVVILDFAYNDYSRNDDRAVETPELLSDPRVVILHTFSKLYGLAGLRVGYGIAHPSLWSYVHRVREPFNVNRVAQRAAAAALHDEQHRIRSQEHVAISRIQVAQGVSELGLTSYPTEGNFILIQTGDATEVTRSLMGRGVMVRQGFGLPEHIRVTFGTEEENLIFLDALKQVLQHR